MRSCRWGSGAVETSSGQHNTTSQQQYPHMYLLVSICFVAMPCHDEEGLTSLRSTFQIPQAKLDAWYRLLALTQTSGMAGRCHRSS